MKILLTYFLIQVISLNCFCQNFTQKLKENAIEITTLDSLGNELYSIVKNYDILMVGEMHGTNEPASFVYGLAKLISEKEGKVAIGLEIPKEKMNGISNNVTRDILRKSTFFSEQNIDGRNGSAWFELIVKCGADKNIEIFYLINSSDENIDSLMYLEVLNQKKMDAKRKIITLTGNVHNWLIPFKGEKKMATFIAEDTTHFSINKVMSVNHIYNKGTMLNNSGNGLELKTIEGKDTLFNRTLPFQNYFCKILFEKQKQYNYFLFTENITHSGVIN